MCEPDEFRRRVIIGVNLWIYLNLGEVCVCVCVCVYERGRGGFWLLARIENHSHSSQSLILKKDMVALGRAIGYPNRPAEINTRRSYRKSESTI